MTPPTEVLVAILFCAGFFLIGYYVGKLEITYKVGKYVAPHFPKPTRPAPPMPTPKRRRDDILPFNTLDDQSEHF